MSSLERLAIPSPVREVMQGRWKFSTGRTTADLDLADKLAIHTAIEARDFYPAVRSCSISRCCAASIASASISPPTSGHPSAADEMRGDADQGQDDEHVNGRRCDVKDTEPRDPSQRQNECQQ